MLKTLDKILNEAVTRRQHISERPSETEITFVILSGRLDVHIGRDSVDEYLMLYRGKWISRDDLMDIVREAKRHGYIE